MTLSEKVMVAHTDIYKSCTEKNRGFQGSADKGGHGK